MTRLRRLTPTICAFHLGFSLDEQIERFVGFNASDMVAFSHRELGWRISGDREPIPYETSRFSAPERDDELIQEARRIAAEDARRRANLYSR